jgi:hypothetical protein
VWNTNILEKKWIFPLFLLVAYNLAWLRRNPSSHLLGKVVLRLRNWPKQDDDRIIILVFIMSKGGVALHTASSLKFTRDSFTSKLVKCCTNGSETNNFITELLTLIRRFTVVTNIRGIIPSAQTSKWQYVHLLTSIHNASYYALVVYPTSRQWICDRALKNKFLILIKEVMLWLVRKTRTVKHHVNTLATLLVLATSGL